MLTLIPFAIFLALIGLELAVSLIQATNLNELERWWAQLQVQQEEEDRQLELAVQVEQMRLLINRRRQGGWQKRRAWRKQKQRENGG